MKLTFFISFVFLLLAPCVSSQTDSSFPSTGQAFRLEVEPSSYIAKGWSILGSYGITKDRNLHVGLYSIASTLPAGLNESMFNNVDKEDEIRLTFELASLIRYKIPYLLNNETNPYIGLFFGWETFRHTAAATGTENHLSNFFLTPQIGYEIYIYKQKVYLNPSIRIVYEFGRTSDYANSQDPGDKGPEIKDWLWLPSFSIGVRI